MDAISIVPLKRRAGGHNPMYEDSRNHILKKYDRNEARFYGLVPDPLQKFVADFYGTVTVNSGTCSNFHLFYNGFKKIDKISKSQIEDETCVISGSPAAESMNRRESNETQQVELLCLKNLLSGFHIPSLIDLKMGFRTYREDEAMEKRDRKIQTAQNSTTSTLGIRLSGLEVFDPARKSYLKISKVHGKEMDVETLIHNIRSFFPSHPAYRNAIITDSLKNLSELRNCINLIPGYRFFGCSLFIVYESDEKSVDEFLNSSKIHCNISIIDFGSVHFPDEILCDQNGIQNLPDGVDTDFLLALDNLIKILYEA